MTGMLEKEYVAETPEHIFEMIENSAEFSFTFRGCDYFLDNRYGFGWVIADPLPFNDAGGFENKPIGHYPMSGKAKTPEQLWALPFLDGKSIPEQFNELQFFDSCYIRAKER